MSETTRNIKGTATEQNLVISYLNESQAHARYTFYAQQADKEEYYPIGQIFNETAANELHHAKVFFRLMQRGDIKVSVDVDCGPVGDTVSNLETSIKEERVDGYEFYRQAAVTARKEGFDDIAEHFEAIADVENYHMQRFESCLRHIEEGTVWKRPTPIKWQCLVCGFIYTGTEPPEKCPGCSHSSKHFMPLD